MVRGRESELEQTLRQTAQNSPEARTLDRTDIEKTARGVAEAARAGRLDKLDRERIAHSVVIDRTRRERENALQKAASNGKEQGVALKLTEVV